MKVKVDIEIEDVIAKWGNTKRILQELLKYNITKFDNYYGYETDAIKVREELIMLNKIDKILKFNSEIDREKLALIEENKPTYTKCCKFCRSYDEIERACRLIPTMEYCHEDYVCELFRVPEWVLLREELQRKYKNK